MCGGLLIIMTNNKQHFMNQALKEAYKAFLIDEVPVGAVIVKDGKIIARGYNQREQKKDPTQHAEIIAIKKACKKLKSWRLIDCDIYITIEPCSMCAGAIMWARMRNIYFGAFDPKGGACGSSYHLFHQIGINHKPQVEGGILKDDCGQIMSQYFKRKR
jgi:tRNA(adenine34) deaminase